MSELRVIIDTGVAVSAVLLPRSVPREAFDLAVARGRVLTCAATNCELEEVLRRPKFAKYVSQEDREEFLAALLRAAEIVAVTHVVEICRDPKDNKFLDLAASGNASHLISGDTDLLTLGSFGSTAILTPAQFLQLFQAQPPPS